MKCSVYNVKDMWRSTNILHFLPSEQSQWVCIAGRKAREKPGRTNAQLFAVQKCQGPLLHIMIKG